MLQYVQSFVLLSDNAWHQRYRYDIEDLAEQGDFLDSAYLLLMGELPTSQQKADFDSELTMHTLVHEQLIQFFRGFKHDAHPMAIMVGVVGALSAFEPYSADIACAPASVLASAGPAHLCHAAVLSMNTHRAHFPSRGFWDWVWESLVRRRQRKGNASEEGCGLSGILHHGCGVVCGLSRACQPWPRLLTGHPWDTQ